MYLNYGFHASNISFMNIITKNTDAIKIALNLNLGQVD